MGCCSSNICSLDPAGRPFAGALRSTAADSLYQCGRIVAALRESRWDDLLAVPVLFAVEDLLEVVQSFGGLPVYGWEFINHHDRAIDHWKKRTSLAVERHGGSLENRISLFQEGASDTSIFGYGSRNS